MGGRVLLVVNRKARQGQTAHADAMKHLAALGLEVIDGSPREGERLEDRIRELANAADVVAVGGGDGTLNATVDAVLAAGKPLAVLPLGTANDLARTLGVPPDLAAACGLIASGRRAKIDLGRVNGKHFFNVASIGLSVTITDGLTKERKARLGVFAYLVTAVEAVWKWRPFVAHITVDGVPHRSKSVQVTVGNGRHYGGGLTVVADAAIDDQRLDVLTLEVRGWWELVPLLPSLLNGTLADSRRVRVFQGTSVEVVTKRAKRVNTDGEITTHTPARFDLVPAALEVFVPPDGIPHPQPAGVPPLPGERPVRRAFGWVGRHQLISLLLVLVTVGGLLAFLWITSALGGGGASFDESVLRAMRTADDPHVLVGPRWLAIAMRDVTALGAYTVLTLVTLGAAGYLAFRRRSGTAALLLAGAIGGAVTCEGLKGVFARPRPAVVPHLDEVLTASFPSGHAGASAAVYLTLAVVLARVSRRPVVRAYLLAFAVVLTGLVGVSRVFLGVHYPTDVLAGWAVGLCWALLCGLVASMVRRPRRPGAVRPSARGTPAA